MFLDVEVNETKINLIHLIENLRKPKNLFKKMDLIASTQLKIASKIFCSLMDANQTGNVVLD